MSTSRPLENLLKSLLLIALVAAQGCNDPQLPSNTPLIETDVTLSDTLVATGDTVTAAVRVSNNGYGPKTFWYACEVFLDAYVVNLDSYLEDARPRVCVYLPTYVELVIAPGESFTKTFKFGYLNPLSPGRYAVRGGIDDQRRYKYPWAEKRFVVVERSPAASGGLGP